MDLEARSLQPSMKATLLAKLREYKTDLNNLKNEVKRVTSANANITARDELLELGRIDSLAVYLLAILPRILIGVYLFELRV
jgi:vesicle transport through interaction with t-SNAREs 1